MRTIFLILLVFPNFLFASFPIFESVSNDTLQINGSQYKEVAVDSLYKYPLLGENITQYRDRLKRNNIKYPKNPNESSSLKPWQIYLLIIIAVFSIIVISVFVQIIQDLEGV